MRVMSKEEFSQSQVTGEEIVASARKLSRRIGRLKFRPPVTHVYNPLTYAWRAHEEYLRRFGNRRKRVVFLGMNPGPFGMVQTGVPFGEVAAVRDWMQIRVTIDQPSRQHPKRPVLGLDCHRSEVSGRRLWRLFADRFGSAENFFAEHFVANYCPLAFCEKSGCNRTPDKLPVDERERLFLACDVHLNRVIEILGPEWLIAIGGFALKRAQHICPGKCRVGQILHPSPASPLANRGWAKAATDELMELGVWR